MKIPIENAAAIGKVVRASRKAQKIRQDDAAGSIGVSENFLGKIERGSESVQWGKLFQVPEGLGPGGCTRECRALVERSIKKQ